MHCSSTDYQRRLPKEVLLERGAPMWRTSIGVQAEPGSRYRMDRTIVDPITKETKTSIRADKAGTCRDAVVAHDLWLLNGAGIGISPAEARRLGLNYDLSIHENKEVIALLEGTNPDEAFLDYAPSCPPVTLRVSERPRKLTSRVKGSWSHPLQTTESPARKFKRIESPSIQGVQGVEFKPSAVIHEASRTLYLCALRAIDLSSETPSLATPEDGGAYLTTRQTFYVHCRGSADFEFYLVERGKPLLNEPMQLPQHADIALLYRELYSRSVVQTMLAAADKDIASFFCMMTNESGQPQPSKVTLRQWCDDLQEELPSKRARVVTEANEPQDPARINGVDAILAAASELESEDESRE